MKLLPKSITEIYAFIISKASVITYFVLHFILFGTATDKVLLRLHNVIHGTPSLQLLIALPDFNY